MEPLAERMNELLVMKILGNDGNDEVCKAENSTLTYAARTIGRALQQRLQIYKCQG